MTSFVPFFFLKVWQLESISIIYAENKKDRALDILNVKHLVAEPRLFSN